MLDLNSCTMRDVIAQSVSLHPSFFAEALRRVQRIHTEYATVTHDAHSARIASTMALDLSDVAYKVEQGAFAPEELTFSQVVQSFSVAAKLQCMPEHIKREITRRS
jgi:hypothetical protein